jgi:hypothetical protein
MFRGSGFEGGEPVVELVVELLVDEVQPCLEIAGVGGFEGIVVVLAETGGNGDGRIGGRSFS